MCGIFGIVAKNNCSFDTNIINDVLLKIAKYSEVRGKDSSGIAIRKEEKKNFEVFKGSMPII